MEEVKGELGIEKKEHVHISELDEKENDKDMSPIIKEDDLVLSNDVKAK